jgi:hypothetical protein
LSRARPTRWRQRRLRIATGAAAAALVALALHATGAGAVILPATTIDGPSEDIVGFGGVAMAEDGTGGIVYLKRVEGVTHVFVSRYVNGAWMPPIRVDGEQQFAGSWPRIGAASGGELIVVWATPFATQNGKLVYELLASVLGPGSSSFGQAAIIDPNVGEATGTSPDLAVSSTGQADLVYRVVEPATLSIPPLRPGDVPEQVRAAHFSGTRWSSFGAVNRNPSASMRPPTTANAPQIAIGPNGNGIVVWQEPDVEGVARIWARRIFGTSLNFVMPATATTYNGAPISDDADAPSVAFSQLGQAEVAYRQTANPGSPLPGPRIFLNILPDGESVAGSEFSGAAVVDQSVPGGLGATVGPPSIDIDERRSMRLLYDSNGVPRVIEGNDRGLSGALSLGPAFAGSEPIAASVMNPEGGGVSAWPSSEAQGHPSVAIREDFPSGAVQTGLVSAASGGEVAELAVGRSGLGDGIIGFRQGPFGNAAIVAARVSAPPAPFVLTVKHGWVKPSQAVVNWQEAPTADGPLTYKLVVDGHVRATPAGVFSERIDPRGLGTGAHRVQVLATDASGESTLTAPVNLLIDGSPPLLRITHASGHSVRVRVTDAGSGVEAKAVRISFGDGSSAHGRARYAHRYAAPGTYLIVASVRDLIGNAAVIRRWVTVR